MIEDDYSSEGYITTKSGDTGIIDENTPLVAVFTNTRDSFGNLTITKTVISDLEDKDKEFAFTITLGVEGSYTGSKNGTLKRGDTIFLKHNDSITISDLPIGVIYECYEKNT